VKPNKSYLLKSEVNPSAETVNPNYFSLCHI
jgi:hypothetical protein